MIFTFGHGTMPLEAAKKMLVDEGISLLIDARSHPTSNHAPQWKLENIVEVIPHYAWEPSLGGWTEETVDALSDEERLNLEKHGVDVGAYTGGYFPKNRIGRSRKPTFTDGREEWNNWGLYDYSWYMATHTFHRGIVRLKTLEKLHKNIAIMCCEHLWWRCHRSMVADALCYLFPQDMVVHLQPSFTNHKSHAIRRLPRYEQAIRDVWGEWL